MKPRFISGEQQISREVDLIIDKNGILHTFEIKWNPKSKVRLSKTFCGLYPNHTFNVIHKEYYWKWLRK
jgi:uncharacterized protein